MKIKMSFIIILIVSIGIGSGCKKEEKQEEDPQPPKPDPEFITDIDGNVYKTIRIGTQLWMAENLRTTKFSDGTIIPTTDPVDLDIGSTGYHYYQWITNYDSTLLEDFGRAYTQHVAKDPFKNICPDGWHVPTEKEWKILLDHIGGDSSQSSGIKIGGKLMVLDTNYWEPPLPQVYSYVTNETGFTALGGGYRVSNGRWLAFKRRTMFAKADGHGAFRLRFADANWSLSGTDSGYLNTGVHIRCVMD